MDDKEPDSPRTGGPRRLSAILPPISGSMPKPPPTSSATIGTEGQAPAVASPTGQQHGETGAVVKLPLPKNPLAVFDLGPSAEAARLGLLLGQQLVWGEKTIFSEHGFERVEVTDVAVRYGGSVPEAAKAIVAKLCAPCEASFAGQILAKMRVMTVSRNRGETDTELLAAAYTEQLAKYPQDVVAMACSAWVAREKWWPSWAELQAELDKRMRGRRALQKALAVAR